MLVKKPRIWKTLFTVTAILTPVLIAGCKNRCFGDVCVAPATYEIAVNVKEGPAIYGHIRDFFEELGLNAREKSYKSNFRRQTDFSNDKNRIAAALSRDRSKIWISFDSRVTGWFGKIPNFNPAQCHLILATLDYVRSQEGVKAVSNSDWGSTATLQKPAKPPPECVDSGGGIVR
jgi:hypothetical protein